MTTETQELLLSEQVKQLTKEERLYRATLAALEIAERGEETLSPQMAGVVRAMLKHTRTPPKAEPICTDCGLPWPEENPYCFCRGEPSEPTDGAPETIGYKTRKEWFDHACRDDCFDSMVPSDLRALINASWGSDARIAELEAFVGSIANPDNWSDEVAKLQWMGKRHAIEYAQSVLKTSVAVEKRDVQLATARNEALEESAKWHDKYAEICDQQGRGGATKHRWCAENIRALKSEEDG